MIVLSIFCPQSTQKFPVIASLQFLQFSAISYYKFRVSNSYLISFNLLKLENTISKRAMGVILKAIVTVVIPLFIKSKTILIIKTLNVPTKAPEAVDNNFFCFNNSSFVKSTNFFVFTCLLSLVDKV